VIEAAFIGTLGRDAEVKTSGKGKSYLKLDVGVAEGDDAVWVSTLSFDEEAIARSASFTRAQNATSRAGSA
jgi:hypothetical protein